MEGSPDPLVVILGTVAFAVATIGGVAAFAWLWAWYARRKIPSAAERSEMIGVTRERQNQVTQSLRWLIPLGFLVAAPIVAGFVAAANGPPSDRLPDPVLRSGKERPPHRAASVLLGFSACRKGRAA